MYVLNAYKTRFFYHNFGTPTPPPPNYKPPLLSTLIWSTTESIPSRGRFTQLHPTSKIHTDPQPPSSINKYRQEISSHPIFCPAPKLYKIYI